MEIKTKKLKSFKKSDQVEVIPSICYETIRHMNMVYEAGLEVFGTINMLLVTSHFIARKFAG